MGALFACRGIPSARLHGYLRNCEGGFRKTTCSRACKHRTERERSLFLSVARLRFWGLDTSPSHQLQAGFPSNTTHVPHKFGRRELVHCHQSDEHGGRHGAGEVSQNYILKNRQQAEVEGAEILVLAWAFEMSKPTPNGMLLPKKPHLLQQGNIYSNKITPNPSLTVPLAEDEAFKHMSL